MGRAWNISFSSDLLIATHWRTGLILGRMNWAWIYYPKPRPCQYGDRGQKSHARTGHVTWQGVASLLTCYPPLTLPKSILNCFYLPYFPDLSICLSTYLPIIYLYTKEFNHNWSYPIQGIMLCPDCHIKSPMPGVGYLLSSCWAGVFQRPSEVLVVW